MKRSFMRWTLAIILTVTVSGAGAMEPVDKNLISEGRALLNYLESIYGDQTLSGISGVQNAEAVFKETGKKPAIVALDLSGWNSPTWGETYTPVVERMVETAIAQWRQGAIVAVQFHWKHPGKPDGTAWVGKHGNNPPSGPFDLAAACKPGTEPHRQFMEDLARHADYLEKLADARVPILWRPFHEIDGGWFWWTDKDQPENTAELWRQMFNYLVKERKIHNLIWVYSAGLKPAAPGKDVTQIAYRQRFYPGAEYVDISGIDIYPNDYYGWAEAQDDAYQKAFDIMQQVSPGKMLALAECGAIPNPDIMETTGPRWLYVLPWWGPGDRNPAEWVRKTYTHKGILTRDEVTMERTGPPQAP